MRNSACFHRQAALFAVSEDDSPRHMTGVRPHRRWQVKLKFLFAGWAIVPALLTGCGSSSCFMCKESYAKKKNSAPLPAWQTAPANAKSAPVGGDAPSLSIAPKPASSNPTVTSPAAAKAAAKPDPVTPAPIQSVTTPAAPAEPLPSAPAVPATSLNVPPPPTLNLPEPVAAPVDKPAPPAANAGPALPPFNPGSPAMLPPPPGAPSLESAPLSIPSVPVR